MEALTLRYVGVIRLQFLGPCHTTGNFHELVAMIGRAIYPHTIQGHIPTLTSWEEVWWCGVESWQAELPWDFHWKSMESGLGLNCSLMLRMPLVWWLQRDWGDVATASLHVSLAYTAKLYVGRLVRALVGHLYLIGVWHKGCTFTWLMYRHARLWPLSSSGWMLQAPKTSKALSDPPPGARLCLSNPWASNFLATYTPEP